MEITKIRRVLTVAVKLLSITIILNLFSHTCTAQIVKGTFYGDNGIIYHFNDSTFKTITRLHIGKEIAKGSFNTTEDTLYLNFKSTTNSSSSNFKFLKREPLNYNAAGDTTSFSVKFIAENEMGKPLSKTSLLVRKNKKTIKGFVADSLGEFPEIFIFGNFDGAFEFTFPGRQQITIQADTLSGYLSKVKVLLSHLVNYNRYEGTNKYLIKHTEKNRIELLRLEDNKKIVLERKGLN